MKSELKRKLLKITLSIAAVIVTVFALGISASAASYPSITLDMPRIGQKSNTGDCAIASIATVEAYMHGLPSGVHTSKAYQEVYAANGYSIGANWGKLGFEKISGFKMETLYEQLSMGYPVIVHRSSSHYSVVYGYIGNADKLELSGFQLIEVDDWYTGRDSERQTLSFWAGSYTLDQMVLRHDGLAIAPTSLLINGNHPPLNSVKGKDYTMYGMVLSNKNITNVTVSIKNSSGNTVYSYSATPNSTQFKVSKANDNLKFDKLSNGNYTYEVYAKDSSGTAKTTKFAFAVGNAASTPTPAPTIKETSYSAKVTAATLNVRTGPGTQYDVIATLSLDTIISVTAESDNGWAKTVVNGKTGWVSLSYIKKYTPTITVAPVTDPDYGLVTNNATLKESSSIFAATLGNVPKNTVVIILDKKSIWIKVRYNGKEGWVLSAYVLENVGDVDNSGTVNSSDALLVLQFATGSATATNLQRQLADINGDGKINSHDALVILQTAVGLKNED